MEDSAFRKKLSELRRRGADPSDANGRKDDVMTSTLYKFDDSEPQGVRAEIMTITPELATQWLEEGEQGRNARRIRNRHVAFLSNEIRSGRWDVDSGHPIIFGRNGNLTDGQHRLWAVVLTGMTIRNLVLWGFDTPKDRGRPRSFGDYLYEHGYGAENRLAAVVTGILRFEQEGTFDSHGSWTVDFDEGLELLSAYPSIEESSKHSMLKGYRVLHPSPTMIGALHFILGQVDSEARDEFFYQLESGANIEAGSPIFWLRKRLIDLKMEASTRQSRIRRDIVAATFIKAWNDWREGKTFQRTPPLWNPDNPFPTIK